MAFVRKATVEMDGASVVVSPLTTAQAEEFFTKQKELLASEDYIKADGPGAKSGILQSKLWAPFVVQGINNADSEIKLTVERLRAEMDPLFVAACKEKIMEMTGVETKAISGETKAP